MLLVKFYYVFTIFVQKTLQSKIENDGNDWFFY